MSRKPSKRTKKAASASGGAGKRGEGASDGKRREVDKPLALRTIELLQGLQVISDSLVQIRKGRMHHVIPLAGQLRALLTERSKKADPLLLEMAHRLGTELSVFAMPDAADEDVPLRESLVVHIAGFPVSLHRQLPHQEPVRLTELMDRQAINLQGTMYSIRTLIEWFANKAGGAHYSRRLPQDFAKLQSLTLGGQPALGHFLAQVGEVVLASGVDLLRKSVDFDLHLLIAFPEQTYVPPVHILDSVYPGTAMRIELLATQNRGLEFRIRGIQGAVGSVRSDRLLDWSSARHVSASLAINDDLSSTLVLTFDGTTVGTAVTPYPLFVLSEQQKYDTYHNRAADGDPQDFSIGICSVFMFGRKLDPYSSAKMLVYLDKRRLEDMECAAYQAGSFGRAKPGTKNLKMSGKVRQIRLSEYI